MDTRVIHVILDHPFMILDTSTGNKIRTASQRAWGRCQKGVSSIGIKAWKVMQGENRLTLHRGPQTAGQDAPGEELNILSREVRLARKTRGREIHFMSNSVLFGQ